MPTQPINVHSPAFGCLEIERIEESESAPFTRSRYTWRPAPELADHLPRDFSIRLECFTMRSGERRFFHSDGANGLILTASLAGFALRSQRIEMQREQRFSYHATRLLYQQAPGLKEHLGRSFTRESDLRVAKAGRSATDDAHVLPPSLGLDSRGRGKAWSPKRLISEGRAAAISAEIKNPDQATRIRYGLLAAARLCPFDIDSLKENEGLAIVRLRLFALGSSNDSLDDGIMERVQERLWRALEQHIDDPKEDFNDWFFKKSNEIVHAIAKQKKHGGPIERETARQAILELVFRSFTYVGDCVHVFMDRFARSLPQPLSEEERLQFNVLYLKQRHLGGLPLLMIHDRFDFLKEAIMDVWDKPGDSTCMGVLLRLLTFYGEMVGERRNADREYKRRGGKGQMLNLDPNRDSAPRTRGIQFQAIARSLAEAQGIRCSCSTMANCKAILAIPNENADSFVIEFACKHCGHNETATVTRDEFRKAGEILISGRDDDEDYCDVE